jgi:hypothetical protein
MFKPGNPGGPGRPRISLDKPELLLPIILRKGKVNWANDFITVYKAVKAGDATPAQRDQLKLYLELMPYLCTKVAVKELDFSKWTTPEEHSDMKKQADDLIKALEGINVNAKPTGSNKAASLEDGQVKIPPTNQSA